MTEEEKELRQILQRNTAELSEITGNLVSVAHGQDVQSLFVTSAHRGEGKTTVAAGIAYGLSMAAKRDVALVEATLCTPGFHLFAEVEETEAGFFDYLLGDVELDEITHNLGSRFPVVIPAGTSGASERWLDAFEEESFREKLKAIQNRFLYSVFDGDAVLAPTGSAVYSHLFDGVVLTVECGNTKWQVAGLARDKLIGYGANVLGVALNRRRYPIPGFIYSRV
jgi:Mrp family chromosome partitioning ATPase